MPDLRERFRALDALDVPDVMTRARIMGPKPPDPDPGPTTRRVGALVFAAVVAVVAVILIVRAVDQPARPAEPPTPPTPSGDVLRTNGEVITERPGGPAWGLAARDPETSEVRKIVDTQGIIQCSGHGAICENFISSAEWSSDGRWVAFDVSFGSLDRMPWGPCGQTAGVWVGNATGNPRQLTAPCDATPGAEGIQEQWAWSPVDAQLAYARVDGEADELFVIDPSDGRRTRLATADDLTALEWSADGTRIAYADGGAFYEVPVDGGERTLLVDSVADVVNIEWSPDGTRIMILDRGRNRLQVMNADGSNLHVLIEGEDACCDPVWSPDGDRIAYMLSVNRPNTFNYEIQIWTVSPDGSNPIKVFDSGCCVNGDANPVWSPDGTQVAWMSSSHWAMANADGTGEAQPIDPFLYRSWSGGGLTEWDLIPLVG